MVRLMKLFIKIFICFILLLMSSCSESESVKMVELNYGKYQVPETLKKVITLQKKLNDEGVLEYGDMLGLFF
jgi:ABC-type Fe3+-citrate transport system substrate-binding protein